MRHHCGKIDLVLCLRDSNNLIVHPPKMLKGRRRSSLPWKPEWRLVSGIGGCSKPLGNSMLDGHRHYHYPKTVEDNIEEEG